MPPIENEPVVCHDEDLVDDEDDESEEEEYCIAPAKRLDEIEEDEVEEDPQEEEEDPQEEEEEEDDDTSSSNLPSGSEPILPHLSTSSQLTLAVSVAADPISSVQTVTIALPATDSSPEFKRQRIEDVTIPGINKPLKPLAVFDESRRLFQRLWTDEDEIELLQGFLDYTMNQRFNSGSGNGSSYHHDTSAFYDQIKNKLQLDFNKNQLVEKLRRVKKKYRTIISKIGSGNEYVFKSSHDEASFEICKKIWSTDGSRRVRGRGGGLGDDHTNPNSNSNSNPSPNPNPNSANNRHNNISLDAYSSGKKSGGRPSSKRFRGGSVKAQQQQQQQEVKPPLTHQFTTPTATTGGPTPAATASPSPIPSLIEETVRSCLPPLLKDLLPSSSSRGGLGGGGMGINALPFGLLMGGSLSSLSGGGGDAMLEEKWRKQQIMELEVYSKRLDLVQDDIKSALVQLRSMQQQPSI